MKHLYYTIYIYLISLRWIFRINLGSEIIYQGRLCRVLNGTRLDQWKIYRCPDSEAFWVPRKDCTLRLTFDNLRESYFLGVNFYKKNWLKSWKQGGVQDWHRALNIW